MTTTPVAGKLKKMTKKRWLLFGALIFACEVRSERAQPQEAPTSTRPQPPAVLTLTPPIKIPTQTPEEASLDYLKNGLAAVWGGRITTPEGLMPWFVPGETSAAATAQIILRNQPGDGSRILLDAVITAVRPSPTLTEVDYFISTTKKGVTKCYNGTLQWVQQPEGRWLRTATSTLTEVPGCSQKENQP